MESPPEENLGSLKISDTEVNLVTTPPSSDISPKKSIQLGVVQSSSGVRTSPSNLSLSKKSRWDQAPGSGENEGESKEANNQPNNQEESNIKNLIKKFEVISGSSKLDVQKSEEVSSTKPGRVKLVRTNFAKPENPIKTSISSEKVDIEIIKAEETDKMIIAESPETPQKDVIPVSSSKALQIISSNYDSPSDESSQEAESSTQSETTSKGTCASPDKAPKGNSHDDTEERIGNMLSSSLNLKDESGPKPKEIESSLSLKNESEPKSDDIEVENKNHDLVSSKKGDLEQNNLVKESSTEQTLTVNVVESELSAKCSEMEVERVEKSKDSSDTVILKEENSETSADENEKISFDEKISDDVEHLSQSSGLLNQNILSNESKNQCDSEIPQNLDIESKTSFNINPVSEKTDIVKSIVTEADSKPAQLEDFELAIDNQNKKDRVNDESSVSMSEHINTVNETDDSNVNTASTLPLESKEYNDVNITIDEKPSDKALPGESSSLYEDVHDFVIITEADLEGYDVGIESTSASILRDEVIDSSKIETINTDNLKDESFVHPRSKNEDGSEVSENTESLKSSEHKECIDRTPTENIKSLEKTETELDGIFGEDSACDKPENGKDKSQSYSDGVDAKMEQIFSENPGSLSEVTCSPEQKNEADLIVVPKENVSSEDDLTLGDSSPKQEDSEIVLETNDSLLQLLQSGGSPKADICQKPKGLGIEMEVEPVEKLEKSKTEYIVQTVSETPSKQNDSGKKSFLGEENIKAPTENLEVNFLNIEDVKTEQTCSEDKSIRLVKEGTNLQYSPENVISEEEAVKDDKSDMVLSKKDLDLKPCNISNDQISVDFVKNSGMQNISKDYSFDIKSVESKNSSKGLEQSVPESSKKIKTDREERIEGDRQLLEKATVGEEKSEIIIEEMEDVQLTDICKDSPTSLKTKTDGDGVIEGDMQPSEIATAGEKKSEIIIEEMEDVQITDICKDSPTNLEANVFKGEYSANISDKVPETSTDVVKAKVDRIEDSVDFKNPEVKDSEMQSLEVEDIIPVEINNDEKKPFECIQAKNVCESSDIPAKAKELDSEIKETNTEEDVTSMYCVDDINPNTTNTKMHEEEISNLNLTIKPDKNVTILKSPENKIIHEKDFPGSSHQKDTLNESKELPLEGDLLVADTKNVDVDSKQSSKEEGGSIEVSQQETIERSIDMLFEMPNSEQPLKTSTVCPVSSSKDIRLDVSSETKKMFSEEIHKEMLKLSPEHKAQCEVETIDLPAPGRLSPIKESGNQDILKLKNDATAVSGSCEVAKESSIVDDKDKDCEESVEFDIEKEIVKASEDSDIATIQAIDSFLEGDNVDIKENISESNSKCGNLTVDQSQTKIIADEDSNNFSNTANERTNAEDVMLGVEGDLDLDNSLTYDSKKLDLSPSSEPSISEENYDLPGDSYDKESLVKEQENTNILSDVLDDVEANIKEDDAELLEVPKVNEVEELSLAKTTAFSECPKDQQVFDKGRLAHKDIELEINKAAKCDIDSSLIKTQPVQCNSKTELEICKDIINQGSSRTEDTEIENSSLLHKPDDLETEQPKDITRPSIKYSSDAVIESKQVQRLEEYSNKDSLEKNVEKSESKITKEIYQSASNELPVKLSESKDVDLDFESLIPSSTVLSKEKIVLDSTIKDAKGETVEGGQGHLENVSKEPSFNTKPDVRQKSNESLTEEFNSCKTKASSTGKEKELEESKSSTLKHTSNIADQVSSVDISSNNDIECDIKLSKKLCQENEEIHHVSVEQDNSILEVNKSNQLEKPASNEVELKSSEEHIILKADISTKEKLIIPTIPNQTLESHSFNKGNIHNKDEDVCPSISSNLATEALSSDESMTTEKNTMGKSTDDSQPSIKNDSSMSVQKVSLDTPQPETCSNKEHVESHSSDDTINTTQVSNVNIDTKSMSNVETESKSNSADFGNQNPTEAVSDQAAKLPKAAVAKEIPAPVRVSARQKQRQAAAAAALAAKEKAEATKSPGQGAVVKKGSAQDKPADKRSKKSLSPTKELQIKISGKSQESGKQSPLSSQKSPKIVESKINLQISPKKNSKEVGQDKLEPITLKLSKEENPVIVRSSSLSPKKNASPHSPQGKTLGYTLKIGKDSTTIIPKDSTPSPTRRESSPGSGGSKADLSGKVGYLIKDTGLTITPVAPAETQEQKLSKITLKLSKAGGHPEIKQENKSETWKAIRKLGEIDIVPVEGKSPTETAKRKDKSEEGSPEKKIKLADVTMEPSTSSGVSKLQGLLTQAPLNQSDSSEDGKFIGFGSPSEKVSPSQQQQQSYDIGMIRHDDSPQPPRKRGRPRKITSPDDIVHSVSVPHTLPSGLTAKDILAASLQHQSLQQHVHPSYQSPQSYQPPEDVDSSQPMVPLFDLFEETFMEPSPPTIFPDQVQPSTDIIMRSARGRPIGRSRRPRGSGLMRGHERGGPRGRPRGSRGLKRILEEMEAMSFPDPDQPITLENIDAEMGPRMAEHAASELTMALLRKSIEGKKEILEKKARKSDGSDEGNGDLDAQVREMKEKIEAAYQAELKSPSKEGRKRTPEKLEEKSPIKKSPPGLIPIQKQEDRRKSAEGKEAVKRKLSEDKSEEGQPQAVKRKSADEKLENVIADEGSNEESTKEDAPMEVDQPATSEEPSEEKEIKTEPEPPPKPVKPRPRSKAEIKRIKREKDRLRREAKKLAALEALKAPPPNPCEEDTRMSASDPNGEGIDGEGLGIKKNRMEVGDPEGKEFTVEQIAEYQWPLQGGELYMIQEQISTWLGVKSFQRKYPDLKRRRVEMEERTYLCDSGLVAESMCDLGLTAVSSSEVLDIMFQDFPDQYEELRKHMREKQARELINKQKERKKFEQTLSKSDLKEHAIQSLASWNANLNKSRNETRKCHLDLQTWTIQYPRSKAAKMTRPAGKLGGYPVALISGQYADYYKRYTAAELRYFPVNTVLYGPLQPNEMHSMGGSDGSQSESEDSSSSDGTSDSSSEGEGEGTEEEEKEKERECKTCGSKKANEAMLQCSQCSHNNTTVTVWA